MYVYIAIGSARKFIVVANYLKLPLLSTRQPNYLKLPMRRAALCAGTVLPERTVVVPWPAAIVENWPDIRGISAAQVRFIAGN